MDLRASIVHKDAKMEPQMTLWHLHLERKVLHHELIVQFSISDLSLTLASDYKLAL